MRAQRRPTSCRSRWMYRSHRSRNECDYGVVVVCAHVAFFVGSQSQSCRRWERCACFDEATEEMMRHELGLRVHRSDRNGPVVTAVVVVTVLFHKATWRYPLEAHWYLDGVISMRGLVVEKHVRAFSAVITLGRSCRCASTPLLCCQYAPDLISMSSYPACCSPLSYMYRSLPSNDRRGSSDNLQCTVSYSYH